MIKQEQRKHRKSRCHWIPGNAYPRMPTAVIGGTVNAELEYGTRTNKPRSRSASHYRMKVNKSREKWTD